MKNNSVFIVRVAAEEISEEAWKKLEEIGCQVLYSSEEDGLLQFFCHFPEGVTEKSVIANYPAVLSIVDSGPLQIDWESQWAQHAPGYRDGYLYVGLGSQAKPRELKLKPGPGFGDLSHPTTRLMLKLMCDHVGNSVLDVGCGSGILSLAALAMGAASVHGIDIDDEALVHSRCNSQLNGMDISFMRPEEYIVKVIPQEGLTVLMNMIWSEQDVAWDSLKAIHPFVSEVISSGVLLEDDSAYLKLCRKRGWKLLSKIESEGWMAYHFRYCLNCSRSSP